MNLELPSALRQWIQTVLETGVHDVEALIPEASTRRFWRIRSAEQSFMAMHSPPESERNTAFVELSRKFRAHGIPVPEVFHYDSANGFLLVEDVGTSEFLDVYQTDRRMHAVNLALDTLVHIQRVPPEGIEPYTRSRFLDELDIFVEWVCGRMLEIAPGPLLAIRADLVTQIQSQPTTVVHRDFHSRNLLIRRNGKIGIVDFQDALVGPATYDLASLLYDCYFEFDENQIRHGLQRYLRLAKAARVQPTETLQALQVATELCAVQRQLKAVGIFCRLWFRQRKATHLKFVLPVLQRVQQLCVRHRDLKELGEWLAGTVAPTTAVVIPQLTNLK